MNEILKQIILGQIAPCDIDKAFRELVYSNQIPNNEATKIAIEKYKNLPFCFNGGWVKLTN